MNGDITGTGFYGPQGTAYGISGGTSLTFYNTWTGFYGDLSGTGGNYAAHLRYQAGSAASPTYSFVTEESTGIFRAAANSIGFSTSGSEKMRITSGGSVGIGTTSPSAGASLHVKKDQNSQTDVIVENANTGAGAYAEYNAHSNAGDLWMGMGSTAANGGLAYVWTTTATPLQIGTNSTERIRITSSGNVGIATTTPSQALEVNGTIKATDIILTSDRRYKTKIEDLSNDDSLERICRLRPVSFEWKSSGRPDFGLIAQELREVFPDLVIENPDRSLSVRYNGLMAPLISSVQKLKKENDSLAQKVKELSDENREIKKLLYELKDRIDEKR